MRITLSELKKIIRKIIKEENEHFTPIFNDRLIIDKSDRAFVGVDHNITPTLSDNEIKKIKEIGDEYGYWFEGNGQDNQVVQNLFGEKIIYEGSWDNKISNIIPKEPYVYMYTLFANVEENKILNRINRCLGETVFDKAVNYFKNQNWRHEKLKNMPETVISDYLTKFINEIDGRSNGNYYNISQQKSTEENVNNFILSIEKEMWDNWPNGISNAAKLAFRANSERDQHLIDTIDKGVIFIGRGHLVLLEKLLK